MARQRIRTIGQIVSDIRDIVLRPSTRLPVLTCSICGKEFFYRGDIDADCITGSTFDPVSGTYKSSGGKAAICNDCQIDIDFRERLYNYYE